MPWFKPYSALDSFQRTVLSWLVGKRSGSSWIQGYAGTGKTIILVNAMEKILADAPNSRVAFVSYTHALKDLVKEGMPEALRSRVTITTKDEFKNLNASFDHVFVDEIQDVPKDQLKRILSKTKSLIVAGDADQRIYLHGADSHEIASELNPDIQRLTAMHRLTPVIKNLAMSIMPKARLVEGRAISGVRSVSARLVKFESEADEAPWVFEEALGRASPGEPSVVLISKHSDIGKFATQLARAKNIPDPPKVTKAPPPTGYDYSKFNAHFEAHGIAFAFFGSGTNELAQSKDKPMVFAVTFHSSKGLDFRQVFIPYCTPSLYLGTKDDKAKDPDIARRLLFVAVTRTRQDLFMSYCSSHPHELLLSVPDDVTKVTVPAGWKPEAVDLF